MNHNRYRIPQQAQADWLNPLGIHEIQPIAGGLSSSRVWRLNTRHGPLCLKAWPAATTPKSRLAEIHRNLSLLSAANIEFTPRILYTPAGSSWLEEDDHFWEVTTWMPGEADLSGNVSADRRAAAAKALALIHHRWQWDRCEKQISPGLIDRIERLRVAQSKFQELAHLANFRQDPQTMLGKRTLEHLAKSGNRLCEQLESLRYPVEVHYVIRDIHAEHVLYEEKRVTGVIDFGAARVDEPLLDLVRLLGSQSPHSRDDRHESLRVYCKALQELTESPTTSLWTIPRELQRRFDILDEASTLLAAVQWLEWLVIESREFVAPKSQVLSRWDGLLRRLESIQSDNDSFSTSAF